MENSTTPPQKTECSLHTGEIVEIQGGKFRINSIGKRMLMLEVMPSTTIQKFNPAQVVEDATRAVKAAEYQRNNVCKLLIALIKQTGGKHEIPAEAVESIKGQDDFKSVFDPVTKIVTLEVKAKEEVPA